MDCHGKGAADDKLAKQAAGAKAAAAAEKAADEKTAKAAYEAATAAAEKEVEEAAADANTALLSIWELASSITILSDSDDSYGGPAVAGMPSKRTKTKADKAATDKAAAPVSNGGGSAAPVSTPGVGSAAPAST